MGSASNIVNCKMDKYSYIGSYCTVVDTNLGAFCSIADNVIIGGASHSLNWVSTSPVFSSGRNILKKNFSNFSFIATQNTIIKNDVWIGSNSLIKGGIVIESGAVIGMGSVVTKNIGAYEIWAGNPAKIIRSRFDKETINSLLKSEWWKINDENLNKHARNIKDINYFLKMIEIEKE